jgi:hypothetical protein
VHEHVAPNDATPSLAPISSLCRPQQRSIGNPRFRTTLLPCTTELCSSRLRLTRGKRDRDLEMLSDLHRDTSLPRLEKKETAAQMLVVGRKIDSDCIEVTLGLGLSTHTIRALHIAINLKLKTSQPYAD